MEYLAVTVGQRFALNLDAYFMLTLNRPGFSAFGSFRGMMDGNGMATATLTIPPSADPTLAGITLNHAYLSAEVLGFTDFTSNAVSLTLLP